MMKLKITGVRFSAKYCVICIFRPVVVTGACTCHFTISQILNKSTKISKNQNKPTQGPSHNYMSENAILLKSGQAWATLYTGAFWKTFGTGYFFCYGAKFFFLGVSWGWGPSPPYCILVKGFHQLVQIW